MGINPLMSMISHFDGLPQDEMLWHVTLLYGVKFPPLRSEANGDAVGELDTDAVLFLDRLAKIFVEGSGSIAGKTAATDGRSEKCRLRLFFTGCQDSGSIALNESKIPFEARRMQQEDVLEALGPVSERASTVVYVCAKPDMTDRFVALAKAAEGMREENVMSEKWW